MSLQDFPLPLPRKLGSLRDQKPFLCPLHCLPGAEFLLLDEGSPWNQWKSSHGPMHTIFCKHFELGLEPQLRTSALKAAEDARMVSTKLGPDRQRLSVNICPSARYTPLSLAETSKDEEADVNYGTQERREKVGHQARSVCARELEDKGNAGAWQHPCAPPARHQTKIHNLIPDGQCRKGLAARSTREIRGHVFDMGTETANT